MLLDVRDILYAPGKELPFQFQLDLSDLDFSGRRLLTNPVEVQGRVRNMAGVLELDLTARTTLDTICDRCCKPILMEKVVPFSCMLAEELAGDESDDIVLLQDGKADVGDLARTAFILGMDTKILCSEDCQGLCPQCGANLNLGPCSCKKEPDPRLAVLAKLLENH